MRFLFLTALGCFVLCAGCATTGDGPMKVEDLLPAPGFAEGWVAEGPANVYDPVTVSDYIDGEAELFYPYGFETLASVSYVHNGDVKDEITADLYAMGSLLDAFGIYSNYRDPSAETLAIGAEGYCDGYQLMFYQDRYFVRLSASGARDANPPNLAACAKAIAARLPGDTAAPAELGLLQVKGLVAKSQKYIGESLLGYKFFPKGLIGEIALDGDAKARALVVFGSSPEGAAAALDGYTAYVKEEGGSPTIITIAAGDAFAVKDPLYKGAVVLPCGPYLLGVIGVEDPGAGAAIIEQLAARCRAAK